MSRVGRKPVALPQKVDVNIDGQHITVKGPKGQLEMDVHPDIRVAQEDGSLVVTRPSDEREHRALHGLTRALLSNMVNGVSTGFRRTLLIEGVGYNAEVKGRDLLLKLGYSHDITFPAPEEIIFEVPKEKRGAAVIVNISGINKELVGQVASDIRRLRPPEPYKGKGIRYEDEIVRRKAGKTGKK